MKKKKQRAKNTVIATPIVYKVYHRDTGNEYYFGFKPNRFNLLLLCLDHSMNSYEDLVNRRLNIYEVFDICKVKFERLFPASP